MPQLSSQQQKVRIKAMDLLARREHSQKELRDKLINKGYPEDLVIEAVEKLAQEKLQSDVRFIENFIRTRSNQGYGPIRIKQELRMKGVEATAEDLQSQDWYELALQVKQKKFGENPPKDLQSKAKQIRFLQYKGFTHDQIDHAIMTLTPNPSPRGRGE